MGKKWKRLLVQRRKAAVASAPATEPVEEVAVEAPVVEAAPVAEEAVVEAAPVVEEAPKPRRRRSTRRKKTASEN